MVVGRCPQQKFLHDDVSFSNRRYWTKGGTLRKIPIGGAIRKKTSVVVKRTADVSSPTVENIPVKTEGGEASGLNIGLSIFASSSSSKVD
nr:hypothetical protein [Tanacetum cinerariifolium]